MSKYIQMCFYLEYEQNRNQTQQLPGFIQHFSGSFSTKRLFAGAQLQKQLDKFSSLKKLFINQFTA